MLLLLFFNVFILLLCTVQACLALTLRNTCRSFTLRNPGIRITLQHIWLLDNWSLSIWFLDIWPLGIRWVVMRESSEDKGLEIGWGNTVIRAAMVVNNHYLKNDSWLKGNLQCDYFFAKNLHLDCNLIQNQLKIC